MATHSSIPAWRIPWTEKPGGLLFKGSQRVGHDWMTKQACILRGNFVVLTCIYFSENERLKNDQSIQFSNNSNNKKLINIKNKK